ncbi:Calcium permeable stress-gated cation channel 1, partial [Globisporangium splendens]
MEEIASPTPTSRDVGALDAPPELQASPAGGLVQEGESPAASGDDTIATDEAANTVQSEDESVGKMPARATVGIATLIGRSKYCGEINAARDPHGMGVLDSPFGFKYAGAFRDGKKHGFGVGMHINGSTYAGGFADDQPSGYGVHTSPFAEKYMGQWSESACCGYGLFTDSSCNITFGVFAENELVESPPDQVTWDRVEYHVQRALVAERHAIRNQEIARERQLQAALEELSVIGMLLARIRWNVDSKSFDSPEQILQFEAQEQLDPQQFVAEQSEIVVQVERVADGYNFCEAEQKQQQKMLRVEIDARSKELSFIAKYCELAKERKAQVFDAERTLEMLQKQLSVLQQQQQQGEQEV